MDSWGSATPDGLGWAGLGWAAAQAYYRRHDLPEERDNWDLQREVVRQRSLRSKRLHSIPEVAEDEAEGGGVAVEAMGQRPRLEDQRPLTPHRGPRVYHQDYQQHNRLSPSKCIRRLQRQRSSPRYSSLEDRVSGGGWLSGRQTTKSPDSGLDCGSEEEGSLGYRGVYSYGAGSPMRVGVGPNMRLIHCEGPVERRALAAGRKRTLTRQSSVEEDFLDVMDMRSRQDLGGYYHHPRHHHHHYFHPHPQRRFQSEVRLTDMGRSYYRENRAHSVARLSRGMDEPLILGSSQSMARLDHTGRRVHGCAPSPRRPMMVPSIDGYGERSRRSPDYYESEPDDFTRIFVALFDYDPLSMSPNPDAGVEELPFKEGQIIKVFGDKDTDGFYRAEIGGRRGLIPCNMVSEIQTEDDEMMDQLLKQGFLPLNTPVEKIERNRRSGRQHPVSTRRMVALYDYDPRESSPNVDVEAELTFCAGDVITVFGEIDEDGFYYGELNGHKGLVPSNFLEEVPEDVEVYLTDTPSRYPQEHPPRTKTKRVHHLKQC
ncbi:hypothetical protein ACEWY4_012212 [Coilia grayii]|uniref:SH3 domain-containing protein n=1 Tax=Coilia grayii TaxID=363190 RepID=A0ABD1JZV2_9TELE